MFDFEELEGLNEEEFQYLLDNLDQLASFMQQENNLAILTAEQLERALAALRIL